MEILGEYLKVINDNIIVVMMLTAFVTLIVLGIVNAVKWLIKRYAKRF